MSRQPGTRWAHPLCDTEMLLLLLQDEKFSVTIYKVTLRNGRRSWEHLAGLHAHYKPIRSVIFGVQLDSNEPRLLSLGEDRLLVRH